MAEGVNRELSCYAFVLFWCSFNCATLFLGWRWCFSKIIFLVLLLSLQNRLVHLKIKPSSRFLIKKIFYITFKSYSILLIIIIILIISVHFMLVRILSWQSMFFVHKQKEEPWSIFFCLAGLSVCEFGKMVSRSSRSYVYKQCWIQLFGDLDNTECRQLWEGNASLCVQSGF